MTDFPLMLCSAMEQNSPSTTTADTLRTTHPSPASPEIAARIPPEVGTADSAAKLNGVSRGGRPRKFSTDPATNELLRFEMFISPEPNTGCWLWTGGVSPGGYGQFTTCREGKITSHRAHKWNWQRLNGPVPEGLQLDHLCHQRSCVNPAHLEAVTPLVNSRRRRNYLARRAS